MPFFCAMRMMLSLMAGDRAFPWSSDARAGTWHWEEHHNGPKAIVPCQAGCSSRVSGAPGPCPGTPCPRHGQVAVHVEMAAAAQAEQVPCESRLGGEQSVSSPHPTALPGTGGWEAHRALPSPDPRPCQLLHARVLLQRGQLRGAPGPELFRVMGFVSSPCAEGDVL